jgi:hypothetical protein
MRLIFRIVGTWMLALAVVLIVIDGTKSLAANELVTTSLADYWRGLSAETLAAVEEFLASRLFAELLDQVLAAILAAPAFLVVGVPGLILAVLGRTRQSQRFVTTDRI